MSILKLQLPMTANGVDIMKEKTWMLTLKTTILDFDFVQFKHNVKGFTKNGSFNSALLLSGVKLCQMPTFCILPPWYDIYGGIGIKEKFNNNQYFRYPLF